MNETSILFESHGAVALVSLNRPAALNSFTPAMHQELRAALDRSEADPAIRALVITGAGRGFCAGIDLSTFDFSPGPDFERRSDPTPAIEELFNPLVRKMHGLRMPIIAAVNGVAAGAGASVALACDITLAAPGASFIQAFSKIGLIPDSGGSWFLPERLGLARAMALAMTGDKLLAPQAKEWGLIWDVSASAEALLPDAMALAQRLAVMPTKALVATRHLLRAAASRSLDQQLDAEHVAQGELGRTHDYVEGVRAFLEKRAPSFKGA